MDRNIQHEIGMLALGIDVGTSRQNLAVAAPFSLGVEVISMKH